MLNINRYQTHTSTHRHTYKHRYTDTRTQIDMYTHACAHMFEGSLTYLYT